MKIFEAVKLIKDCCKSQSDLIELTEKFDKTKPSSFIKEVPNDIEIDEKLKTAIKIARDNIFQFHKKEFDKLKQFEEDKIETSKEIFVWKKFTQIDNVGIYIPNKLFSSVLMNVIPAQICGCKNIIICTPPNPSNEILWTLNLLGIEKIYTIGGAQAVFAMAFGIGEIPKVDKIFGPGNEFVDEAKKMVSNEVAIDMPAGPSEVLIIADENANKKSVIYDLLAQLEHGKESKAWLFSNCIELVDFVKSNIKEIALSSKRVDILNKSLENLAIEKVESISIAIDKSNKIAPEHLIFNVLDCDKYLDKISNAGSVFIGKNTPESLGDYLSGTNHVLPTCGFAKSFSGLSVLSFGKFITFQKANKIGLEQVSDFVKIMSEAEGLDFHGMSVVRNLI